MAGTYARKADTLVIGGGPGGYMAAIRLGQLGVSTILVERQYLGGECLNRGCIPSKALIHASELYDRLRTEGPVIGVVAPEVRFDLPTAMAWKESVVQKERQGVRSLLKSAGVTVLAGEARFSGPHSAQLAAPDGGQERIDFTHAVIATGAVPIVLPGFETDGERVVNAWDLLSLKKLPASMLVLGGGVSGCELGEFLARVGVRVTIIEMMDQLLPGFEADLTRELTRRLTALGIEIHTSGKATALERARSELSLTVALGSEQRVLKGEMLFVTIGKRPDTRSLDLAEAGVQTAERGGFVSVNDRLQTNVPHIYAVGDVARPPMLAHKAYREGLVAAESIAGRPTRYGYQCMPSVVFTDPELGSVGLSIADANARGITTAREVRFPYAALGRAHANHATDGWVKIVGDDASGLLLGVHIAGASAGELTSEAALAIEMGAQVRDIAGTIHPHPTYGELLAEAALLWLGEPMHVAARRAANAQRP